jgi:hypothetical protein
MLQEVSWASDDTKSFLPRHKRAYSPSSSSMTNHDLPKTPTDAPNDIGCGSGKLGKRIVSENPLSETILWRTECLSPSQVVKKGNQVFFNSSYGPLRVGNYCLILGHRKSTSGVTRVAEQYLGHSTHR